MNLLARRFSQIVRRSRLQSPATNSLRQSLLGSARQALALLFITSLLASSTFAAAPSAELVAVANGLVQDARFAFLASDLASGDVTGKARRWLGNALKDVKPKQTRQVARLEVTPAGFVTMREGEQMRFAARALDSNGETIPEAAVAITAIDAGRKSPEIAFI